MGSAVPRRLGELSYSLYLWHWPIHLLLPRPLGGVADWGWTATVIGLSLLAAVVAHLAVRAVYLAVCGTTRLGATASHAGDAETGVGGG